MKYHLSSLGMILVLAMLFILGNPAFAQGGTTVQITPGAAQIKAGEVTELEVTINNVHDLYGVELTITYDPAIIEIVDAQPTKDGIQVEPGDFLSQDFEAINEVTPGLIHYAMTQVSPHSPVSGNGVLLKFTVRGKTNGKSAIQITGAQLADLNGNGLTNVRKNGVVMVGNESEATPVPTAVSTSEPSPTAISPSTPTPSPLPPTPQPTAETTPHPQPTATERDSSPCRQIQGYHIVKSGETLYSIGRAYATYPRSIAACNQLLNPTVIYAGTKLAIPYAPWTPVPTGPTATRQFTPKSTGSFTCRNHIVQRGETLLTIGWRYGVDIWILARLNHLSNPNLIYVGQTLCIP